MADWFEDARRGDPTALARMARQLRPRMERMAHYYARRTGEDSDDLLQEAWVGLLDALPALDIRIGKPEQYLLQRARWRMLDAVKRQRLRRCAPLEEEAAEALPDTGVADDEANACIHDFTGRLKALHREVLECLLDGFTWRETGTMLGCTSANVAYHVRQIQKQYVAWNNDPAEVPAQ